jgi:molybdopterin-guanine dinucleotide biosynthesis protein A
MERSLFTSAAVLAGGQSRRMGFDKSQLRIGGRPLLEGILKQLDTRFDRIVIVADREKDLVERTDVEVMYDLVPGIGPLAGLYTALKHFREGFVFLTACDMPVVDVGFIDRMKEEYRSREGDMCDAILGKHIGTGMIEPFHAFYSCGLIPEIERILKVGEGSEPRRRSFHTLLHDRDTLFVDMEEAGFSLNLNRQVDVDTFIKSNQEREE